MPKPATVEVMPSLEEVIALADQLTRSWDALIHSQDFVAALRKRGTSQTRPFVDVATTFGLCAHVHRLVRPALAMIGDGLVLESIPLVRTMFESALTAHWIIQVPGAGAAFYNEQSRQQKNVLTDISTLKMRSVDPAALAEQLAELEASNALPTDRSSKFQEICLDLTPGGNEAYAHYRIMCGFTHPSGLLVDQYFAAIDEAPFLARRPEPTQPSAAGWAAFATGSLV
jgi:hypothetical protein